MLIVERDHYQALIAADTDPGDHLRHAIALAYVLLELGDEPGASRALDTCPLLSDEDVGHRHLRARVQVMRAACALARHDLARAGALLDRLDQNDDARVAARAALVRGYFH